MESPFKEGLGGMGEVAGCQLLWDRLPLQTLPQAASAQSSLHVVAEHGRSKGGHFSSVGDNSDQQVCLQSPFWDWSSPAGPPPLTSPSPQLGFSTFISLVCILKNILYPKLCLSLWRTYSGTSFTTRTWSGQDSLPLPTGCAVPKHWACLPSQLTASSPMLWMRKLRLRKMKTCLNDQLFTEIRKCWTRRWSQITFISLCLLLSKQNQSLYFKVSRILATIGGTCIWRLWLNLIIFKVKSRFWPAFSIKS